MDISIPPSFKKFGDNFIDPENRNADVQHLLESSVAALSSPEKRELARFLEDCISSEQPDEKLRIMWMRTGAFWAFSPMRAFFRQVLDELRRPGK